MENNALQNNRNENLTYFDKSYKSNIVVLVLIILYSYFNNFMNKNTLPNFSSHTLLGQSKAIPTRNLQTAQQTFLNSTEDVKIITNLKTNINKSE